MPAVTQALAYTAAEARDTLRDLVDASRVDATRAVADTLAELDAITAEFEARRAELDAALDEDTGLADTLAAAITNGGATVADAVTKIRQHRTGREERSLYNKLAFLYDKRADRSLRKLGNTVVTDILSPWAELVVSDLITPAAHIVEHGHRTTFYENEATDPTIYDTADRLVVELHSIYGHANTLRRRGVLTPLADGYDPRLLVFKAPHRLADLDLSHRQTWWMSFAVTNGAGPTIRTSHEAEAAAKHVA